MAIIFIKPIKVRLDKSLAYITDVTKTSNEDFLDEYLSLADCLNYSIDDVKTEQQFYVSGINCIPETALEQMIKTKKAFHKTDKNLGYHIIQSFDKHEGTPELVHEIGKQLANELWGSDFEVVVATHRNTDSLHNHIVINSVSLVDGRKYYDNRETYKKIREVSDRLCFEHGLSVILNPKQKSRKPHSVYMAERYGNITKDEIIKRDIDECILKTISSKAFYRDMYALGYTFNFERKYPTISHPDFDRPRRLKTLGDNYTPEAINERILAHWLPQHSVIPEQDEPVKEFLYPLYSSGYKETYVAFIQVISVVKERPDYNRELQKYLVEECQKLDRLIEQQNLICDNNIETDEDLLKFKTACKDEISVIAEARKQLRSKLITAQRHDETDKVIELKSDISLFSERLKILRKDIRICERIEKQKPEIEQKISQLKEREYEKICANETRQNRAYRDRWR